MSGCEDGQEAADTEVDGIAHAEEGGHEKNEQLLNTGVTINGSLFNFVILSILYFSSSNIWTNAFKKGESHSQAED